MMRWASGPEGRGKPRAPRWQPPAHSPLSMRHISAALRSLVTSGDDHRAELRRRLSSRFQADEVVLCSTGTNALEVAILAARRLVGDAGPVALPAFTCYDVATAAVAADVPIVLYDVVPETLTPDLGSCAAALRRGARVLVVTPLFGFPPDWQMLQALADLYGAVLVEDVAQGHGASWKGEALGTLGQISTVSFGRGKGWTGGRGGAVLVRGAAAQGVLQHLDLPEPGWREELGVLARALAQTAFAGPGLYWLPASLPWLRLGQTVYRQPRPVKSMCRLSAALILATETDADAAAAARRERGRVLLESIRGSALVKPVRAIAGGRPSFLRAPVLLADGLVGSCASAEARRLGITTSYPTPLTGIAPVRARLELPVAPCPGAEALARRLVTLPTHGGLAPGERARMLHFVNNYGGHTLWSSAADGTDDPSGPLARQWRIPCPSDGGPAAVPTSPGPLPTARTLRSHEGETRCRARPERRWLPRLEPPGYPGAGATTGDNP